MSHRSTPWLLGVIALLLTVIAVLGCTGPHRQVPTPTPTPPPAIAQEQAASINVETSCVGLFAVNCGNATINTDQEQSQPQQARQPQTDTPADNEH